MSMDEFMELKYVNTTDTDGYIKGPFKDGERTILYPYLIDFFMLFKHWFLLMMVFNCAIGAWMFYVVQQLIGRPAWLLFALGSFTMYVPFILTDMIFATIFITSIWQLKERRLWLHFLLLGVASLIRPNLAWFFLVEPFVLYFYGYNVKMAILSLPIVFVLTAFTPARNYINMGKWTHSTILEQNMNHDRYWGGHKDKPLKYAFYTFKSNYLSGHHMKIGWFYRVYKRDQLDGYIQGRQYIGYIDKILALINLGIWLRFLNRVSWGKVNWGNVIILLYMMTPTFFAHSCGRMRLPIEWILLL